MQRVTPNRLIIRQVVGGDDAAVLLQVRNEFLADRAVIEFRDRRVAEALHRVGELLCVNLFAGRRRGAVLLQENFLQARVHREHRGVGFDLAREMLADGKAIAREFDRGRGDLLKLHGAEALQRRVDARDLARHGDRERADLREFLVRACPSR